MRLSHSAPNLADLPRRRQTAIAAKQPPRDRAERVAGRREMVWEAGLSAAGAPLQQALRQRVSPLAEARHYVDALARPSPADAAELEALERAIRQVLCR